VEGAVVGGEDEELLRCTPLSVARKIRGALLHRRSRRRGLRRKKGKGSR
jgi:hypothetical protein